MIGIHAVVISCCLLSQTADAPSSLPTPRFGAKRSPRQAPAADERHPGGSAYDRSRASDPAERRMLDEVDAAGGMAGDREANLGQVGTAPRRLRPPELLADALSGPHQGHLPAQNIPLVDALAKAHDREMQRRIAVTYWRLAIAQAQLHYARANLATLHRWHQAGHKQSSLSESQMATAEAAQEEAEFRTINEAETLAGLVGLSDDGRILVTIDRPHVGDYRTKFERAFNGRTPPPRLRLIHRTLPVSRRAIDVHGAALVATQDALENTEEDYRQGKADFLTLAGSLDRLMAAQSAFLASILRYNEDIAEYAFFVAPAEFDAGRLVKTLIIRPAPANGRHVEPPASDSPEAMEEPFDASPLSREPTHPTFRQDRGPSQDDLRDDSSAAVDRRARIWLVARDTSAEPSHGGLYQGLLDAEPAEQARKLTELLHWDRELPPDSGERVTLLACLERVPSSKRRAVIGAYWETRRQIALYQVLGERSASLAGLGTKLLSMRDQPGAPAAMLRLQAARSAAQAAVLDQHIQLLSTQYELVLLLDSPADRPWPLPSTPPHGGGYTVAERNRHGQAAADRDNTAAAQQQNESPSFGLAGTRVIVLHDELGQRARALVFADEFRALHTPAQERRPAEVDGELWAIDRQLHETETFLSTLSNYNLAVADYVLPLLPPDAPAKGVVDKLVIEPSPRTDT
jgi:hypothetical protein